MLGRLYDTQECSAARTLELVGERWTLLILRDAIFRGYTRFSQFQQVLGVAPNILTKRLNALVDNGILRAVPTGRPDHHDYVLTEMGADLKPTLMALTAWGDRWVRPGPAIFVHDTCGTEIVQRFHCPQCDETVEHQDIRGEARPDFVPRG
ncbi:MAG TPA: helix-turn-helix domain-containing protein [Stackebrandtia sp.]|jgi:DNA-binding HxlR family transcriptional regulator|uniref:winged helix-turn-helix transcriptional regulator n=1 Tax=Stackebrandtia sp. TaxID=2023065 RepID=UPI002D26672C|nr:helix-turn-helix domain-containing protein [Stackebrandtia sp.]HZE40910.1 helix-turn-helix domain-containing protein [Stackebrandtia sp.]